MKPLHSLVSAAAEIARAYSKTANFPSFARVAADLILFRLLRFMPRRFHDTQRTVVMRGGSRLTYRLNYGDVWSLREVWLFDDYRLPFDLPLASLIDLGGNIGLCSVWLAKRYNVGQVLLLEPVAQNFELAEENLRQNRIGGRGIQAAIGPRDGVARFEESERSNLGRVSDLGSLEVPMMSMATALETLGAPVVDLLKVDIEGAEQQLLSGDLSWLARVRSMIVEFHPDLVDYPALVARLQEQGFQYIPAGSVFPHNMDCFINSALSDFSAAAT